MSSSYEIAITPDFLKQLHGLEKVVFNKWQRVGGTFFRDPFHPTLSTEKLTTLQPNMYSARLDDNYRIIFRRIDNLILLLWVDAHDAAYAKARRLSVALEAGRLKITEAIQTNTVNLSHQIKHISPGRLFEPWTNKQLETFGVPVALIDKLRQMNDLNDLEKVEVFLSTEVFDRLLNLFIQTDSQIDVVPDEQTNLSDLRLKAAIHRVENSEQVRVLEEHEFETALSKSLAEWMLFLHPSQRQLVEMKFSGPARIKGGAGTGKTVIAIHRALYLARIMHATQERKVLFLTYNNRLAGVIESLLDRFHPNISSLIEVRTLHSWSGWYLSKFWNIQLEIAPNTSLNSALVLSKLKLNSTHYSVTALVRRLLLERDNAFLQDEIGYVIKGRATGQLETYLDLRRTGRGVPLNQDERRVIFDLYTRYQEILAGKGQHDWDDLILQAFCRITERPVEYAAVIVDEVQDFAEVQMRLIKEIAGEGTNKLLLIGDGQQSIYKGGFSLRNVGISITGRARILRQNYRNTQQILEAAYSMMRNTTFNDLEDDEELIPEQPDGPPRVGKKPVLKQCASATEELQWVASQIHHLIHTQQSCQAGDIAILYRDGKRNGFDVDSVLNQAGIQVAELSRDRVNSFNDPHTVKRCTFHSAKGLEFKVVFLIRLSDDVIPMSILTHDEDDIKRERRLLFVAMTRARDYLYMSYSEVPRSRFLNDIDSDLLELVS